MKNVLKKGILKEEFHFWSILFDEVVLQMFGGKTQAPVP